jgi:hypothetical protein
MNLAALRNPGRLTIQARIALLVIACILPAWLLAAAVTYVSYEQDRSDFKELTLETTRGLMRLVERDLAADMASLQTLATSNWIDQRDFAAFHAQAKEVLPFTSGYSIVLTDPSGQQVMNILRPFGAPLPRFGSMELLQRVLDTRQPVVSDVFIGGVTGRSLVAVAVPVIRDGKGLYMLNVAIDPKHLGTLLQRQGLPPQWVVSVFDGTGTTRCPIPRRKQCRPESGPGILRAMQQAHEGVA